ncbi:unnamed protein product [Musa hybrid cultivar]
MHEFMEISMLSSLMSWQRFFLPVQQLQQQMIRSNCDLSIGKTSS